MRYAIWLSVWLLLSLNTVEAAPQRIVSLNLCSDTLLLTLVEPQRIRSLGFLSADPDYSPLAEQAQGFTLNDGSAEQVLAMQPDLVLAGRYSNQAAVQLLRSLQIPVLELDVPHSLADTRAQILQLAQVLEVPERGAQLVSTLDQQLAQLQQSAASSTHPRAALLQPNGFTSGSHTLIHELMQLAGLRNVVAESGMQGWGFWTLEHYLWADVQLLVVGSSGERYPALAGQVLQHPALRHLPRIEVPEPLWSCPGPWLVQALRRLVEGQVHAPS